MINIQEKNKCCGCSACEQICSANAITMMADEQGFYYPIINKEKCINCDLCNRVCPFTSISDEHKPIKVEAAKNINNAIRKESSSGGIFTLIAEYIIQHGGVVFGARFDDNWNVVHDYTETIEGLSVFRGSKYVQSLINGAYIKTKLFLKKNRLVLFTGTPCQIHGLKNFLRHDYSNLYTIEVFCHGVPSSLIWNRYLKEVIRTHSVGNIKSETSHISTISFRDKTIGWKKSTIKIKFDSKTNLKTFNELIVKNLYMKNFLNNVYLRPSCYSCLSKSGRSSADFSLADFWSIDRYCRRFSDTLGVTLVYTSSQKGVILLEKLNYNSILLNEDKYIKYNRMFVCSAQKSKFSDLFWNKFALDGVSAIAYVEKLQKPSLVYLCISKIRLILKRIILAIK